MEKYDVFVLGTGTAGKLVANRCKDAGLKVGIIDNRAYGGVCSQRGCDPKKLILASSEAFDYAKNMKSDGITGDVQINWHDAFNYARRYTQSIPEKTEQNLKSAGIDCYHGYGSFIDEQTFTFDNTTIVAETFVIATGMMTRPLSVPGASYLLTSDDFFKMKDLPEKMVFVGGGYIGMEFSHMMARAGVKVTIIQRGDQILSPFEKLVADHLMESSIQLGIDIRLGATLSSVEKKEGRYIVHYGKDESLHQVTTDLVYNTAGRIPSIEMLDLEKARVVTSKNGVVVNDCLQSTTNPRFYACGDVSSKNLPLTPLSGLEGTIVAKNITEGKHPLIPVKIPSVTFTIPQVASIGLTEQQARDQGEKIRVLTADASSWFNTRRMNAGVYAYKVIVDDQTGLILGAHIISQEAGETINLFSVAMNHDISFQHLQQTMFTYPSWANDLKSF